MTDNLAAATNVVRSMVVFHHNLEAMKTLAAIVGWLRNLVSESRQYLFDQRGFTLDIFAASP
jgi:hypothetical protein